MVKVVAVCICPECGKTDKRIIVEGNNDDAQHIKEYCEQNPDLCIDCWEKEMKAAKMVMGAPAYRVQRQPPETVSDERKSCAYRLRTESAENVKMIASRVAAEVVRTIDALEAGFTAADRKCPGFAMLDKQLSKIRVRMQDCDGVRSAAEDVVIIYGRLLDVGDNLPDKSRALCRALHLLPAPGNDTHRRLLGM